MTNFNEYHHMRRYIKGRMTAEEKLAFETQMQSDAFLADAVEGFSSDFGAIDDIPKYSGSGRSWLFSIAGLGFAGLLLFAATEILFIQKIESDLVSDIVVESKAPESPQPIESPQTTFLLSDEDYTIEPIATPEIKDEVLAIQNIVEPKETKTLAEPIEIIDAPDLPSKTSEIALHKSDIIFIEDLKIVKEDLLGKTNSESFYTHEHHVPAVLENPEYPLSNLQEKYLNQFRELTYREILTLGLRAFNQGDYQKSLSTFMAMNKEYGSSINHHLYSGLCAFHLDNYELAILEFDKVLAMHDLAFFEEANWYYALSLQASGKKKEAKKRFEEIYKGDGHYAPMAASRLLR